MPAINAEDFQEIFEERLGEHYERARTMFENYGKHLATDVVNVLLHASDKGMVEEVLGQLEEHHKEVLQFQHPDIRGTVTNRFTGVNQTEMFFVSICNETLGLQENASP